MKLTPLAKSLILVIALAVIGYFVWEHRRKAPPAEPPATGASPASSAPASGESTAGSLAARIFGDREDGPLQTRIGDQEVTLIKVPGGNFPAGAGGTQASVPSFYIDRTEVTIGQYRAYTAANPGAAAPGYWNDGAYLQRHAFHPVTGIGWKEADAFCRWAGKRLPSGLEWERAARGDDGRELPWGNNLDRSRARIQVTEKSALKDVPYGIATIATDSPDYAKDESPFGVLGLAGNVAEWTADDAGAGQRAVRGGSWASYSIEEAVVHRAVPTRAEQRAGRLGFRCAVDANAAAALTNAAPDRASSTGAGAQGALDRIKTTGILRVGAEPETAPMMIGAPPGPFSGFDYELATHIAKHLGAEVRIVPGRYADLPGALARGDFDLIISGYARDPSITGVAWSEPYLEYGLALIARSDGSVKSVKDLDGKRVGVFNDPAAEREAKRLAPKAASLVLLEDSYLQMLVDNKLDAFLYDFPYAQAEVQAFGDRVRIVQYNLTDQTYHVGVSPNAPVLMREVNKAIHSLRSSPEYKRLVRTWLGKAAPVEVARGAKTYTVKPGDSLSLIAKRLYQDVGAWPRIWQANKHRIGNPDLIDVGMQLELP